ncbi:dioxygenase [Neisseriaceae bacterium TC5R-5]|nr:dioxygenase [Neisseriaceae bacterium TC5R-5]
MPQLLPALFISHGAPSLVLEDSPTHHFLRKLGTQLPRPRAIVIFSAHWQSQGLRINSNPTPATIHDFYGFPAPLYQLHYPAQTELALVDRVQSLLSHAGIRSVADSQQGLDHGVWSPLMLLYPQADIPLLNLSLPYQASSSQLMAIGRALRTLREEGILLIGSGSYTHNLRQMQPEGSPVPDKTQQFAHWLDQALLTQDFTAMENWLEQAPYARNSHPSDEHLNPLWIIQGAASPGQVPIKLHEDWRMGCLSMACWQFA